MVMHDSGCKHAGLDFTIKSDWQIFLLQSYYCSWKLRKPQFNLTQYVSGTNKTVPTYQTTKNWNKLRGVCYRGLKIFKKYVTVTVTLPLFFWGYFQKATLIYKTMSEKSFLSKECNCHTQLNSKLGKPSFPKKPHHKPVWFGTAPGNLVFNF